MNWADLGPWLQEKHALTDFKDTFTPHVQYSKDTWLMFAGKMRGGAGACFYSPTTHTDEHHRGKHARRITKRTQTTMGSSQI